MVGGTPLRSTARLAPCTAPADWQLQARPASLPAQRLHPPPGVPDGVACEADGRLCGTAGGAQINPVDGGISDAHLDVLRSDAGMGTEGTKQLGGAATPRHAWAASLLQRAHKLCRPRAPQRLPGLPRTAC